MSDALLTPQLSEKLNTKLLEQNHKPGLYVVATPIGNILDISLRALGILKMAQCVFAEDTRQSRKLFDWYGIKTKLVACHEYNETDFSVTSLINKQGIYALISDAGTPTVSDPGYKIVNWCLQNEIDVFPIPGASASIAALSASGMPSDKFTFFGFLPSKNNVRKTFLESLENETGTLIFFESPNRLLNTLEDMLEILGDRRCCVCRELTKIFEEFRRGNLLEMLQYFSNNKPTGEFVILIKGKITEKKKGMEKIFSELNKLLENTSLKESVNVLSEKYKISRKIIYKKALEIKKLE